MEFKLSASRRTTSVFRQLTWSLSLPTGTVEFEFQFIDGTNGVSVIHQYQSEICSVTSKELSYPKGEHSSTKHSSCVEVIVSIDQSKLVSSSIESNSPTSTSVAVVDSNI